MTVSDDDFKGKEQRLEEVFTFMQEMREERLRAEGYQQAKKEIGERIRWWLERVLLPLMIAACTAYVTCWLKG